MFDLFSASSVRPTSPHDRSKSSPLNTITNPQICSSPGLPDNLLDPSASVNRYTSRKLSCSLEDNSIATPDRIHQRSFTPERGRSTRRELPPLVTLPGGQDSPNSKIPLASHQHLDHFQFSPPQSRQASPTKVGGRLADWFNGKSNPITFSILPSPSKERSDPLDIMPTLPAIQTSMVQQSSGHATSKASLSSRFSFFTTKALSPKTTPRAIDLNDEFLDIDVQKALFPAGPADPFSPAAFKNLVQNAEGLLSRLQMAYKERTRALREMTTEKETQNEELDGAETRAQHLKIQLDDIAVRITEQDNAMMNLVDDLAREKQLRREEEEARKRSVILVKASREACVERSQRESRSSINSDWSCESGEESSAESVFSRQHGATSPTMSMSSVSTTNSPDTYLSHDFHLVAQNGPEPNSQPLFKGMAGSNNRKQTASWQGEPRDLTCANCHGLTRNEAWNIVGVLKGENKALKGRVEQMEGALDGCLDVVDMLR